MQALLDTLRDSLPAPILVGDSTQPVYQGALGYRAPAPASWFNAGTGYGTLGYALPAAIGAKLACPVARCWRWWATAACSSPAPS